MKWQMPRLATLILFGFSTNLIAQYGAYGHDVATSSEQTQSIALAVSFLQNVGGENLADIQISNADLVGSLPAASSRDGKHIGIDFARVAEVIPPWTPGAPGHPGLVVKLIFHELQHLHHGWGDSFCQEVELTVHVSSYHCDFLRAIQPQGGGPLDALCQMYDHVRSKVKNRLPTAECTEERRGRRDRRYSRSDRPPTFGRNTHPLCDSPCPPCPPCENPRVPRDLRVRISASTV